MSELQHEDTQYQPPTLQDLLSLSEKLERAQSEQREGGRADEMLAALNDRYETAAADMAIMEAEIEEKEAVKTEIEREIVDVTDMIGNDDTMIEGHGPAVDQMSALREEVLFGRIRTCNQKKRLLVREIAELKKRIDACRKYTDENRQEWNKLNERPGTISKALGHLAMAMDHINNIADIQPVPPLFTDTYRYAPTIADTNLSDFITSDSKVAREYTSIPIQIPRPTLQSIEVESVQVETLRKPPLPPVRLSQDSAKKFLRSSNNMKKR